MIFDIGLFGGGEESGSFTQERFTDHEGEDIKKTITYKVKDNHIQITYMNTSRLDKLMRWASRILGS